jgi:hypothetical protein
MTTFSLAIEKRHDVDGSDYVCYVMAHNPKTKAESVHLEEWFSSADEVATWVEESVDAWC